MTLHIDEINIQARNLFANKYLFGPSQTDPDYLANSMLFLMTMLTGEKRSMSMHSKSTHNFKAENLHGFLIVCLKRPKNEILMCSQL